MDTNLRPALENTLFGQVDPSAFLEAALALTELELEKAIPEPHPSGATRYPVVGTPPGIKAELWIGRTNKAMYGSAMSYVIDCEPPEGLYVVEGAVRSGLKAQITVWTDPAGRLETFGVVTNMNVSGKTKQLGMALDKIPTGLLYSVDVDDPADWFGSQHGVINGSPGEWSDTTLVISGNSLRREDLQSLHSSLQDTYKKL